MTDIVNGLPLMVVVLGMVEFSKRAGLTGRALLFVAFAVGALLGVAYQCSLSVPATYAGWFAAVVYGLSLGLAASGINDWAGAQFKKAA
jgi:hypothetical protein